MLSAHRQPGKDAVLLEDHAAVGAGAGDRLAVEQDAARVGCTKPATMFIIVVLPQPDGPMTETNSPWRIS